MRFNYFDVMVRGQKGYARSLEPVCREWELTRNELDVLLFLANNPGKNRAIDIVTGRGLTKSHVSLSVSNLENRGFLSRLEDPSDRRTIRLTLTEKAHPIAEAGRQAQIQFFSLIFSDLSLEEIELWKQIMDKVAGRILELDTQQASSK